MNVTEAKTLTEVAPGPVGLKGGRYLFSATATFNNGTLELQGMLPDNVSYATVPTINGTPALLSAPGQLLVDLTPGQYQLAARGPVGVKATVASVPV